jgi:hypothetical protein
MSSDAPDPPMCPDFREPMKLVKSSPHICGLPEDLCVHWSRCKKAETNVQEQTAAWG